MISVGVEIPVLLRIPAVSMEIGTVNLMCALVTTVGEVQTALSKIPAVAMGNGIIMLMSQDHVAVVSDGVAAIVRKWSVAGMDIGTGHPVIVVLIGAVVIAPSINPVADTVLGVTGVRNVPVSQDGKGMIALQAVGKYIAVITEPGTVRIVPVIRDGAIVIVLNVADMAHGGHMTQNVPVIPDGGVVIAL